MQTFLTPNQDRGLGGLFDKLIRYRDWHDWHDPSGMGIRIDSLLVRCAYVSGPLRPACGQSSPCSDGASSIFAITDIVLHQWETVVHPNCTPSIKQPRISIVMPRYRRHPCCVYLHEPGQVSHPRPYVPLINTCINLHWVILHCINIHQMKTQLPRGVYICKGANGLDSLSQ